MKLGPNCALTIIIKNDLKTTKAMSSYSIKDIAILITKRKSL